MEFMEWGMRFAACSYSYSLIMKILAAYTNSKLQVCLTFDRNLLGARSKDVANMAFINSDNISRFIINVKYVQIG